MKLMTAFELANRSFDELSALFGQVSAELAKSEAASAGRRCALATLENLATAKRLRLMR